MMIMSSANEAPAKFTNDSRPSDKKLTEPVTYHAPILSRMVAMATHTEKNSKVLGRGMFMVNTA